MKCATLHTHEIDNPDLALSEITKQLSDNLSLAKNTLGIMICHADFIDSGVVKHLCQNLPFEIVGMTTSSLLIKDDIGMGMLSIFIITADDVSFSTVYTEINHQNPDVCITDAYQKVISKINQEPKLALLFTHFDHRLTGDVFVNTLSTLNPKLPVFGGTAMDDSPTFDRLYTIHNREYSKEKTVMVLCFGNINPRFIIGSLPANNQLHSGEITKSKGNLVYEIDNQNVMDYFDNIGMGKNNIEGTDTLFFTPFLIHQKKREDYDNIPVLRGRTGFNEDGAAFFHGLIDEGSSFTIIGNYADDVISVAKKTINDINNTPCINGLIIFSCIARQMMVMSQDPLKELLTIKENINPEIPFFTSYVNGEFCPTSVRNNIPTNRFHNFTMVAMVL